LLILPEEDQEKKRGQRKVSFQKQDAKRAAKGGVTNIIVAWDARNRVQSQVLFAGPSSSKIQKGKPMQNALGEHATHSLTIGILTRARLSHLIRDTPFRLTPARHQAQLFCFSSVDSRKKKKTHN